MSDKKFILFIVILFSILLYPLNSFAAPWISMKITYNGKSEDYNAESVYLYVNGKRVEELTMPPIIFDGSTLVPAREVFEPLGAEVDWKKETEEVLISYKKNFIKIKINSQTALVNDVEQSLSMPAKIINGKTMIPARFIAQSLGMKVEWDSNTRIINIREIIETEINELEPIEVSEETTETMEETTEIEESEVTTQRPNVDLNEPECDDGVFKISAEGQLGDFASPEISDKKIVYILSKTNSPPKESYSFDDEYIRKVNFTDIFINNKKFTQMVLYLNDKAKPVTYISKDSKTFVVDFVNDAPKYDNLRPFDVDEEPLSSDVELEPDDVVETNGESSDEQNSGTNFINTSSGGPVFFEKDYLYVKKNLHFNINNLTQTDNYHNREYVIDTGCDLSETLSKGKYLINNDMIDYVEIVHSSSTLIKIKEKKVFAYNITENTEYICIKPVSPREKYSKIVVIDAGHGGHDPGAESKLIDGVEKEMTLSIAKKAVDMIEKDKKVKAYAVRLDDVYYTLEERANFGNELGDMFISVHINSFSAERANGTEVWYYPHQNDSAVGVSCEDLAETLQKNLVDNLKSTDRGVKSTDYVVLYKTNVPAALCEIGFLTNAVEGAKLQTDEYRTLAAEAIYKSVVEIFEKYTPKR